MGIVKRRSITQGFLLIELLVALIVFSCISSVVAFYQWHTSCWQEEIKTYCKAINKARAVINRILNTPNKDFIFKKKKSLFTVTSNKEIVQLDGMRVRKPYYIITVTVSWQSCGGQPRSYKLASGAC